MDCAIAEKNLLEIKDILDKIGRPYWLAFGTFLGAYRNKAIIPYDKDTDLTMYAEDMTRLWVNTGLFLEKGFGISIAPGATTFTRDGEHTDIYPFILKDDKRIWGAIQYDVVDFETLNEVDFLGQRFRILSEPERWLHYTYGHDWRTPIPDKPCKAQPYGRDPLKAFDVEVSEQNLLEIKQLLDEAAIPFWLAMGTFLGAYRDGAIIPYDDDTDIAVYAEDLPMLAYALRDFTSKGFVITTWAVFKEPTNLHTVVCWKGGEHTDIYLLKKEGDKRVWQGLRYDESDLETCNHVQFLGQKWRIISNPERWLSYTYGADWRTPIEGRSSKGEPLGE